MMEGRAANIAKANDFAARLYPAVKEMRDRHMTLAAIAEELRARGVVMPRGGTGWTKTTVQRVLRRGQDKARDQGVSARVNTY